MVPYFQSNGIGRLYESLHVLENFTVELIDKFIRFNTLVLRRIKSGRGTVRQIRFAVCLPAYQGRTNMAEETEN